MKTVQVTLSGKDGGGFAFQNVFHINSPDTTHNEHDTLAALADSINTNVVPAFIATMVSAATLLDIGVKIVSTGGGYTLHKPVNETGTRDGEQAPGAVAGKLAFYPETGANVGHMFVPGCKVDDYVPDVIDGSYQGLLNSLADALMFYDGTDATYAWQFVVYNRKTLTGIAVAAAVALLTVGILSKRVRA